jgi:hypothetical protein
MRRPGKDDGLISASDVAQRKIWRRPYSIRCTEPCETTLRRTIQKADLGKLDGARRVG